jgi:hypothetical protein
LAHDLPEAEDLLQETLFNVAKRWPKVTRMDHPVSRGLARLEQTLRPTNDPRTIAS